MECYEFASKNIFDDRHPLQPQIKIYLLPLCDSHNHTHQNPQTNNISN